MTVSIPYYLLLSFTIFFLLLPTPLLMKIQQAFVSRVQIFFSPAFQDLVLPEWFNFMDYFLFPQ